MQECLRLSAGMGGNVQTVDVPEIQSLEDFKRAVGIQDPVTPVEPDRAEVEIPQLSEDETPAKPTADSILGMSLDDFMKTSNQVARQIASNVGIEIPGFNEQFSLLSEAKTNETFNYVRYIGTSRTQIDVLRAFILMKVGELLNPTE